MTMTATAPQDAGGVVPAAPSPFLTSGRLAQHAIAIATQARVPFIAWGPPGEGKTAFLNFLAGALAPPAGAAWQGPGVPLRTLIPATLDPVDISGQPYLGESAAGILRRVLYGVPYWAQDLIDAGCGILFFDEANSGPPPVQAAMLRVLQEGVVAGQRLPSAVSRGAAANPVDQSASGIEFEPPMANRFMHIPDWKLDLADWGSYMMGAGGFAAPPILPDGWEIVLPAMKALVLTYHQANRNRLSPGVPKDRVQAGMAWASPRTWDMLAILLAACDSAGVGADVARVCAKGCVGDAEAIPFLEWRAKLDLRTAEELFANPAGYRPHPRDDQNYTELCGLIASLLTNRTPERWMASWQILDILRRSGRTDVAAGVAIQLSKLKGDYKELGIPAQYIEPFAPILLKAGVSGRSAA